MLKRMIVFALAVLFTLSGCSKAPEPLPAPATTKLSEHVYVLVGPLELPNKENRGFMNNPGLIITDKGVVVIDPGSSAAVGEMVLAQARKLTDKPVIAVFNTHIHGDHWLGNGAIKKAYPKAVIYAHPKMKARAAADGPTWITLFNQMTEGTLAETTPVGPDMEVNDGETVKLGGIDFLIHHTGKAHTDGDIMIELPQEKVFFTGDIVNNRAVRGINDGSLKGNVVAIDRALASKAEKIVPGHGAPSDVTVLKENRDYFATLYATVKQAYAEGLTDFDAKPKVVDALAAYKSWNRFDEEVGRQISIAYLEAEQESF